VKPYHDRRYLASMAWMYMVFLAIFLPMVALTWWLGAWAIAGFVALALWAYRRAIGARLRLCARRPGALQSRDPAAPAATDS
jgi:hypothetical protein